MLEQVINELKKKELEMSKGTNVYPLVLMKDAIDALTTLDEMWWKSCQQEMNNISLGIEPQEPFKSWK